MELAVFRHIDEGILFVVECDQGGRPIVFMSRTLQCSEMHYPPVEKEATAIIEAVRKWEHLLTKQHFTIITDQRSVAFILENHRQTKIKNTKIQGWRLELASFSYKITYRPGVENVGTDTLTCAFCASVTETKSNLSKIHNGLCHPGVSHMLHFEEFTIFIWRSKNKCLFILQNMCRTLASFSPISNRTSFRSWIIIYSS